MMHYSCTQVHSCSRDGPAEAPEGAVALPESIASAAVAVRVLFASGLSSTSTASSSSSLSSSLSGHPARFA